MIVSDLLLLRVKIFTVTLQIKKKKNHMLPRILREVIQKIFPEVVSIDCTRAREILARFKRES